MYSSLKACSGFSSIYCRCLELYLNLGPGSKVRTIKEYSNTEADFSNANTSMVEKAKCPSTRSVEMLENATSLYRMYQDSWTMHGGLP